MRSLWVVGILLVMVVPAMADAIDDAEAKKRGVPVEVVQLEAARARIKELEKEIAELKSSRTPAPVPANKKKPEAVEKKPRAELPEHLRLYLEYRDSQFQKVVADKRAEIQRVQKMKSESRGGDRIDQIRQKQWSDQIYSLQNEVNKMVREGPSKFVPSIHLAYLNSDDQIAVPIGAGGILGNEMQRFVKVLQVQADDSALVTVRDTVYMVKGVNFKGVVDGSPLKLDKPLIASKTVKYSALGADKTVMLLEVFNPADYEGY